MKRLNSYETNPRVINDAIRKVQVAVEQIDPTAASGTDVTAMKAVVDQLDPAAINASIAVTGALDVPGIANAISIASQVDPSSISTMQGTVAQHQGVLNHLFRTGDFADGFHIQLGANPVGISVNPAVPTDVAYNTILLTENVDASVPGYSSVQSMQVVHHVAAGADGNRQGLFSWVILDGPSKSADNCYVGITGLATAVTDNGTAPTLGGCGGGFFGANFVVHDAFGVAANLASATGIEVDIALQQTGSSTARLHGYQASKYGPLDGSVSDIAFLCANRGWRNGFALTDCAGGGQGVLPTGTVLGTVATGITPTPWTVAYGVDFRNLSFTGSAFVSPGFAVDGSGNITLGNGIKVNWPNCNLTAYASDPVFGSYKSAVFDFGTADYPFITMMNSSGGAGGPGFLFYQNSVTPAANDTIGQFLFYGKDSGAAVQRYGSFYWNLIDPTAGSEDSQAVFEVTAAGAALNALTLDAGKVGSPISMWAHTGTAIPAGGAAGKGLMVSSTANFGIFFGSGAPTLAAAHGSLYLSSDGATNSTRAYINTNGSTGWIGITTAA